MGIMNVTPDSFFAPSRAQNAAEMKARVQDLLSRGCTIIDIGPISTRPGAPDVSLEDEWKRLEPALEITKPMVDEAGAQISVDTFRSEIVRRTFNKIGRFIVNDISAGEDDEAMLSTVAELGLPFIAMHKRGNPRSMDNMVDYPEGVTAAVIKYFEEFTLRAAAAGISDWIVDPGFGFAKTSAQNWELLRNSGQLKRFGKPLLIGVADKRFTKDPEFNRGDLGLAEKIAIEVGADILRIH